MPTQEQFEQSEVGKTEQQRIVDHFVNLFQVVDPVKDCTSQGETRRPPMTTNPERRNR